MLVVAPRGVSVSPSKSLPVVKTIKSSAEITRLFKEGKRVNTPELSLIVLRNEGQHDRNGRVAFVAGKKLGNAVWRNKAKRRMREACREIGGPFPDYDVVFVARKRTTDSKFDDMLCHLKECIERVGLTR